MKKGASRKVIPLRPQVEEDDRPRGKNKWLLLAGVFLVSFSLLSFEISLARVLSVMLYYHYVFMVISLALLGLGAGGIYVYLFRRHVPVGQNRFRSLSLSISLFSLSIPLSVIAMSRLVTGSLWFYGFFLFMPFFFAGVFLAGVFRAFPALSSVIYGVDLIGAALGSLGVVLALNMLGDMNTVLALGIITSIAALFYVIGTTQFALKKLLMPVGTFLVAASLLGINFFGSSIIDIPVGNNPTKELTNALKSNGATGTILETRWSAFGRTDLVSSGSNPEQMNLFIDGTSGTSMYRFGGDISRSEGAVNRLKTGFPGYLALSFLKEGEKDNALIIGPGGGRDVLLALMGDVGKITAVEVNQDLVDIVREYAWYNGGIYTDLENVTVYVDEGRNFLKSRSEKYDIIMLSLPITKTSRSVEGFSLTENFLFTSDSINDYLEHLTDEGRLIVVGHDPIEIMRLLSLSTSALNRKGVAEKTAMEQVYIVGSHHFPVFVLKKTPLETAEMVSIHQSIHELGYEPGLSYLPTIKLGGGTAHVAEAKFNECAMFFPPAIALSLGEIGLGDIRSALQEERLDISPVTDDSPFFYKFEAGIPQSVSLVFWASVVVLFLVIMAPIIYLKKRQISESKPKDKAGLDERLIRFVSLFSMLGVGFMLVEISTIQKFILFLGQPVLSVAVLLFSLMVGAGLGSIYSARFNTERLPRVLAFTALLVVSLLVAYAFSLSVILERLLGLPLAVRLLATVVMLLPPGFFMGFFFPSGIKLLKHAGMEEFVPWMWGLNGVASVAGSAATIVIAITSGFTEALLAGAAAYFIVFLVFFIPGNRSKEAVQM